MSEILITPTEDLLLEVLAARYRLGETMWTFDKRHEAALVKLQARGLVTITHGIVEKTVRASLTERGREEHLSPGYIAPVFRKKKKHKKGSW